MAYAAASLQDFKPGMRVRLTQEYMGLPAGHEGTVNKDGAFKSTIVVVKFDSGHELTTYIPNVVKIGPQPWTLGTRVRAVGPLVDQRGAWAIKQGDEGAAITLPEETVRLRVHFDNGGLIDVRESTVRQSLLIVGPETAAPKPASAAAPGPAAPAAAAAAGGGVGGGAAAAAPSERRHNRWGDCLDAPAAGARDFFPPGWTPSGDVYESIQPFGHPEAAITKIQAKGERLERELAGLDIATVAEYAAAVFAYTEEDPENDLYGKLNAACRTSGKVAEKRLAAYRGYIYHLQEALTTLPTFPGRVYRGTDFKVIPESYAVGKKVTWQQFASASKSQKVAKKFVAEHKGELIGSYFICDVKNGKEIDLLSAFPAEEEVLLKPNTFFTVIDKLESEGAKKAALDQLAAYDMTQLQVFVLKQI